MTFELTVTAEAILGAKRPEDVFGDLGEIDPRGRLKDIYRTLARSSHPDAHKGDAKASEAFAALSKLKDRALAAIEAGTYGKTSYVTFKTKSHSYEIHEARGSAGVAASYDCMIDGSRPGVFTVARTPRDNDLVKAESFVLKDLIRGDGAVPSYCGMLPEWVESFPYTEGGGVHRQANVFAIANEFVPLTQVIEAFPGGMDPRDMTWIWRRLLDVLGYAHSRGYVHGAVLPSNILVGLGDAHDVVLTNWQCAVKIDGSATIPMLDKRYEKWYPPEIVKKEHPMPGTDIYMAARVGLGMFGCTDTTFSPKIPLRVRGFLLSCLLKSQAQRQQDAWGLRTEYGELVDSMWPRQYRPLYLPT